MWVDEEMTREGEEKREKERKNEGLAAKGQAKARGDRWRWRRRISLRFSPRGRCFEEQERGTRNGKRVSIREDAGQRLWVH